MSFVAATSTADVRPPSPTTMDGPDVLASKESPTKAKLRRKLANYRLKVHRLKQKVKKLEMGHMKTTKNQAKRISEIGKSISSFVSGAKYEFIMSQIRNAQRKSAAKRWTIRDKSFALSLFHSSPKTYRLLRTTLDLPAPQTLRRVMRNVAVFPGFNMNILKALEKKLANASPKSKLVSIVIDEMAIKQGVTLDRGRDLLEGFAETPERENVLANHALVFMVRGLSEKWKQPIGYFTSSGPMKGSEMKNLLFDCIEKIEAIGLTPKVVICDQGTNNQNLFRKQLGVTNKRPYFLHKGNRVYAMYDPPHLVKSIRNIFKKHGYTYKKKKILWRHIRNFYNEDVKRDLRFAPKVKLKHMTLPPFKSLRVRLATQVLSHTVASGMKHMIANKVLPRDADDTADFVEAMDRLFNCFNSKTLHTNKEASLNGAISAESQHVLYLKDMRTYMKMLKSNGKVQVPPCISGWQLTITALLKLWDELRDHHDFKFLLTNRLNQDCLENLFSIIRAKGAQRDNPDAAQFRAAFRQVMVDMVMIPSSQANCEEDVDEFLCTLEHFKKKPFSPTPQVQSPEESLIESLPFSVKSILSVCTIRPQHEEEALTNSECNILAYIGGYIVRKLKEKCCQMCMTKIEEDVNQQNPNHAFICAKTYGKLSAPSSQFLGVLQLMELKYKSVITTLIATEHVVGALALELSKVQQLNNFQCSNCHIHQLVLHIFINIRLHHSIRLINTDLKENKDRKNRKTLKFAHL